MAPQFLNLESKVNLLLEANTSINIISNILKNYLSLFIILFNILIIIKS